VTYNLHEKPWTGAARSSLQGWANQQDDYAAALLTSRFAQLGEIKALSPSDALKVHAALKNALKTIGRASTGGDEGTYIEAILEEANKALAKTVFTYDRERAEDMFAFDLYGTLPDVRYQATHDPDTDGGDSGREFGIRDILVWINQPVYDDTSISIKEYLTAVGVMKDQIDDTAKVCLKEPTYIATLRQTPGHRDLPASAESKSDRFPDADDHYSQYP